MKLKILNITIILSVLFITATQVLSEVVTTRKRQTPPPQQVQQYRPPVVNKPQIVVPKQEPTKTNTYTKPQVQVQQSVQKPQQQTKVTKITEKIKSCTPYSERLTTSVYGMNTTFDIKIAGWVNNKCVINFNANTNGVSSNFESLYGVSASDAQIYTFAPKVKCEFTKQQLNRVGDSILEEQARANGSKMLKNPEQIDLSSFSNMSSSDMALMDVVFNEQACTIQNMGDLNNINNILNLF